MSSVPENSNEGCVGVDSEQAGQAASCEGCPNQQSCASGEQKAKKDAVKSEINDQMADVKHKILVLSGKGGVGKSSVACQLAWALADLQFKVGILDIDICGPSVPKMMGVEGEEVRRSSYGWSPVYQSENLAVMSIAFLLSTDRDAVIWRGSKKTDLIQKFLKDVYWGELDFLIIDAPPGSSDEHITIATSLDTAHIDGALLITTPQEIALMDVRKEVNFCKKAKIPVLGVIENMAGFVCPCCKTKTDIFPAETGGARKLAEDMKVPFLGSLPLDQEMLKSCEKGESFLGTSSRTSPAFMPFVNIINGLFASSTQLSETKATLQNLSFLDFKDEKKAKDGKEATGETPKEPQDEQGKTEEQRKESGGASGVGGAGGAAGALSKKRKTWSALAVAVGVAVGGMVWKARH